MKMKVFLSVILWAWVLTVGAKNIETRFDGKKITNDVFLEHGRGYALIQPRRRNIPLIPTPIPGDCATIGMVCVMPKRYVIGKTRR